jgi:LPS-assembly lipoprotein
MSGRCILPRALAAMALTLALPGCGLSPLYAGGSAGPAASALTGVEVGAIGGRAGWLVRNALTDRLGNRDRPGAGRAPYRLLIELDDQITGFGIRGDSAATRERRTLRARYRLVDAATGLTLVDATAGSDAGIDVVNSEYATVAAEQSALERLAPIIADQIVTRIALHLRSAPARR